MVVCKMRLQVKIALLHKFGFVNLPTFILPDLVYTVLYKLTL